MVNEVNLAEDEEYKSLPEEDDVPYQDGADLVEDEEVNALEGLDDDKKEALAEIDERYTQVADFFQIPKEELIGKAVGFLMEIYKSLDDSDKLALQKRLEEKGISDAVLLVTGTSGASPKKVFNYFMSDKFMMDPTDSGGLFNQLFKIHKDLTENDVENKDKELPKEDLKELPKEDSIKVDLANDVNASLPSSIRPDYSEAFLKNPERVRKDYETIMASMRGGYNG